MTFCRNCGAQINDNAVICVNCGILTDNLQQFAAQIPKAPSGKDWLATLLLSIFCGELGIHRFYVGKVGTGLLWLFTGGILGIGYLVDIIMIACGSFKDANGNPLVRRS